ncbi:hypothetical protein LZ32DRAFT_663209 [Colletotrichum eremochloae]|nr:hypothetical protein LZ32DRAFT_663209 [Colletotrichum eremochloae]
MQFTTIVFALLPVLATAQATNSTNPFSNTRCLEILTARCPVSSDGSQLCLQLDGANICMTDCPSQSTCPTQCKEQGHTGGFCSDGNVLFGGDTSGTSPGAGQ